MSFYNFFFPLASYQHQTQQIAAAQRRRLRRSASNRRSTDRRISELEENLGFVSLLLSTLLSKLDENGTVSREDVQAELRALDGLDGVKDGKLDVEILRQALEDEE